MNVLFIMLHAGYLRNFESAIRFLAQRGYHIHLGFNREDRLGGEKMARALRSEFPAITFGEVPEGDSFWAPLAKAARYSVDYLRYLDPRFETATKLRERAQKHAPVTVQKLARLPLVRSRRGLRLLMRTLCAVEHAIPSGTDVQKFIARQRPNVLLVTPLVDLGSSQVDYVKAAQGVGLRTGLCVCSWDNLTNKGLMRVLPDMVTVWNEAQKSEAVELHGVPSSRVVVTGAPAYDHWFDWRPSTTREEFCARVGLAADRPFFLYLCSSPFIGPNEAEFVEKWLRRVRTAAHLGLQEAGVLVRPHPQNVEQWRGVDFSGFGNVAIWPRGGSNPTDIKSKSDYYDSMHHSTAVVGINTSALIEAGIVGRAVYTVLAPEFATTQEGTLHFHHLAKASGGLLYVAADLDAHLLHLSEALSGKDERRQTTRDFVQAFVRPHGFDTPAGLVLADAIEQLGRTEVAHRHSVQPWVYPARVMLYPFALIAAANRGFRKKRSKVRDRREKEERRLPKTQGAAKGRSGAKAGAAVLPIRPQISDEIVVTAADQKTAK